MSGRLLDWLQEEGSARVRDLSAAFAVSEATIRQDLDKLEADGHISRQHGGAFLRTVPRQVETLSLQHMENIDKKRKIGAKAASLVGDGETIILDAGSTTTEIAHNLLGRSSLTVITNALNIALILGAAPGYAVHMPGAARRWPERPDRIVFAANCRRTDTKIQIGTKKRASSVNIARREKRGIVVRGSNSRCVSSFRGQYSINRRPGRHRMLGRLTRAVLQS